MTHILMIAKYFAPDNTIAAVRATKLLKYIKKDTDCEITVIKAIEESDCLKDSLLEKDLKYFKNVVVLSDHNFLASVIQRQMNKIKLKHGDQTNLLRVNQVESHERKTSVLLQETWQFLKYLIEYLNGKTFIRNAKQYLKLQDKKYDVIISTYGPFAPHYIGKYAKKRCPNSTWIADFRDNPSGPFVPTFFKHYSKNYPQRICKSADKIIAVSKGVFDEINLPGSKKDVITNGYDRDDIKGLLPLRNSDHFIITYTGAMYRGKRDFSVLFQAFRELINENLISEKKILFNMLEKTITALLNKPFHINWKNILFLLER